MKKLTKAMLATGGALLLGTGAVANYLMAQQPRTAQEELTLANLEAMAFIDPDELDMEPGEGIISKSCTKAQQAGSDTKGAIMGILCGICCETYYIRPTGSSTCSPF